MIPALHTQVPQDESGIGYVNVKLLKLDAISMS
jgi:hypothetical protein